MSILKRVLCSRVPILPIHRAVIHRVMCKKKNCDRTVCKQTVTLSDPLFKIKKAGSFYGRVKR